MRIISSFSHKEGERFIRQRWPQELDEVLEVIKNVDAESCRVKRSKEKTMLGKLLYSPEELNKSFRKLFSQRGWRKRRIRMETAITVLPDVPREIAHNYPPLHKGFREMDFVKNGLGVEVQFGKYAFMVYNVLAKMTIFRRRRIIRAGIEIVPMARMAREMSTGVSYFEQMKSDLEARGKAKIDIPVLVLGVDTDYPC